MTIYTHVSGCLYAIGSVEQLWWSLHGLKHLLLGKEKCAEFDLLQSLLDKCTMVPKEVK